MLNFESPCPSRSSCPWRGFTERPRRSTKLDGFLVRQRAQEATSHLYLFDKFFVPSLGPKQSYVLGLLWSVAEKPRLWPFMA